MSGRQLCAYAGCQYLVHIDPSCVDGLDGPFCCYRCQARYYGQDVSSKAKPHYKHCEKALPPPGQTVARAQVASILCACPECPHLVHSDPSWVEDLTGPFCCSKCQARYHGQIPCGTTGKQHYKHCERREPPPGVPTVRADATGCIPCEPGYRRRARTSSIESEKTPLGANPQSPTIMPESSSATSSPLLGPAFADQAWAEIRDGDLFCLVCKKYVTEDHLNTLKHLERVEWFPGKPTASLEKPSGLTEQKLAGIIHKEPQQKTAGELKQVKDASMPRDLSRIFEAMQAIDLDVQRPWWCVAGVKPPVLSSKQVTDPAKWINVLIPGEEGALPSQRNQERTVVVCSPIAVGQSLCVRSDYLDYHDDPDAQGHDCNGFLVVWAGEIVCVLYVGCRDTQDAGWIYAKVTRGNPSKPLSRKGWLPDDVLLFPPN